MQCLELLRKNGIQAVCYEVRTLRGDEHFLPFSPKVARKRAKAKA